MQSVCVREKRENSAEALTTYLFIYLSVYLAMQFDFQSKLWL